MSPVRFATRRPVLTLLLSVTLILSISLAAVSVTASSQQVKEYKDSLVDWYQSFFRGHEGHHIEPPAIVATRPKAMDVTISQRFVCQIHSKQHIDVCALDSGYLEAISVKEGQAVKKGDVMFQILPVLYSTKAAAEVAEAKLAQLEFEFNQKLASDKVVSPNQVRLSEAKRDKAKAKAEMVSAELSFTKVVAPFDGIVDRQQKQLGSLIHEGEILTTLSDNSLMWVYFNVPEKQYLEFVANSKQHGVDQKFELKLANHEIFPQPCSNVTVEGQFNNQTGNIAFRADFANPDGVLRHGQTGTILIHRTLKDALIIPQRATFELLDKRYVWVVDEDDEPHQKLITVKRELEDIFVINSGLEVTDKIIFEGVREVEEGKKVEYEFRSPDEVLKDQKFHAE